MIQIASRTTTMSLQNKNNNTFSAQAIFFNKKTQTLIQPARNKHETQDNRCDPSTALKTSTVT